MKPKEKSGNGYFFVVTLTACFLLIVCGLAFFGGSRAEKDTYTVTTQHAAPAEEQVLLDLNTASQEELQQLPGIGPALAEAIVREREQNGKFETADDLLRVDGIGESKLDGLRYAVTAEK